MKRFNGYEMKGLTASDNKIILQHKANRNNLTIDEAGKVYNEGGIYIADANDVGSGLGVYCL